MLWTLFYLSLGLLARLLLSMEERMEVSTPLNSHKRLVEGLALYKLNNNNLSSVYEGVIVHHTPIFTFVMAQLTLSLHKILFVALDLIAALLVAKTAQLAVQATYNREQREKDAIESSDAKELMLSSEAPSVAYRRSLLLYLFHPYIIANSSCMTSTVVDNLIMALFLCSCLMKRRTLAALSLAMATYQSLYPLCLLAPLVVFMMDEDEEQRKMKREGVRSWLYELLHTTFLFICFLSFLVYVSYSVLMDRDWSFVSSIYGFILMAPELTPNVGLFWYFFTEMFDHFRLFFVATFQLNLFIYIVPLSLRFGRDPFCLTYILISIMAIFKSYPCYGDIGLYMSLLPALNHLLSWSNNTFITFNALLASTALMPLASSLWLYNGSANANYLFALNLVFASAQIFLVTGIASAFVRREFFLKNGFKQFRRKGAKVTLVLK